MIGILKIDFRKYFYSNTFWVLLVIFLLLNTIVFFSAEQILNSIMADAGKNSPVPFPTFSLYSFPLVWHNMTFIAGFFKIFLALIVMNFVTGEFSGKTVRLNIMNGMSRGQFLQSKVLFIVLLCLVTVFLIFISGTILGLLFTDELSTTAFFAKISFLPAFFLELFTFCSLALLLALLIQKTGLSIGLLALYFFILEPALSFMIPKPVSDYLPMVSAGNLIDVPNSSLMKMFGVNFSEVVSMPDVYVCSLYSILFLFASWFYLSKKDL